jgi:hypothetical protein
MHIPQSPQNSLSQSQFPANMSPYSIGHQSPSSQFTNLVGKVFNISTCGAILVSSIYFTYQNSKPAMAVPPEMHSNNQIDEQNEMVELIKKFKQENPQGFDRAVAIIQNARGNYSDNIVNYGILHDIQNQIERICAASGHSIYGTNGTNICSLSPLYNALLRTLVAVSPINSEEGRLKAQQVFMTFLQIEKSPNYTTPALQAGPNASIRNSIAGKRQSDGNQGTYAQDNRAIRICNKLQDDMVRAQGSGWIWSREQVLADCVPDVNMLLRSGPQACTSNAISRGETPDNAKRVCFMYRSIAESLGISYASGNKVSMPFNQDPASFTKFLNSLKWDNGDRVYFQTLGKCRSWSGNSEDGRTGTLPVYGCDSGFVTITNPMGTKICSLRSNSVGKHSVQYVAGHNSFWSGTTFSVGECRYK